MLWYKPMQCNGVILYYGVSLCYGVSQCYGFSSGYGVSPCYGVILYYGVGLCYGVCLLCHGIKGALRKIQDYLGFFPKSISKIDHRRGLARRAPILGNGEQE